VNTYRNRNLIILIFFLENKKITVCLENPHRSDIKIFCSQKRTISFCTKTISFSPSTSRTHFLLLCLLLTNIIIMSTRRNNISKNNNLLFYYVGIIRDKLINKQVPLMLHCYIFIIIINVRALYTTVVRPRYGALFICCLYFYYIGQVIILWP